MAKFLFYTYGAEYQDPAALMEKMNLEIAKTVKTCDYITAFYIIIDISNRVLLPSDRFKTQYIAK